MYKITENLLCSTGSTQCPVVTQMGCCLSCSVRSNSFVTPWTVALQYPLPMGFSRQEHWSGLPFPSPEDLSDPGIKPAFPALSGRLFITEPQVFFSKNALGKSG